MSEQLMAGDRVVRVSGARSGWGGGAEGTIVRIIPAHRDIAHMRSYPAKAVVAWPAPRRIGGSGLNRTTVALTALARPDEMGTCVKCERRRRIVHDGLCGTCSHRAARRINTHEMWGHGRRGY